MAVRRQALLLDGGYVEIVERHGGWTYQVHPPVPLGEGQWIDEVPDIYPSPEEAEDFARNRYRAELVSDFVDAPQGEPL